MGVVSLLEEIGIVEVPGGGKIRYSKLTRWAGGDTILAALGDKACIERDQMIALTELQRAGEEEGVLLVGEERGNIFYIPGPPEDAGIYEVLLYWSGKWVVTVKRVGEGMHSLYLDSGEFRVFSRA